MTVRRWDVERAIRDSDLSPPARHLVLALATYTDASTAAIPAQFSPSLTRLSKDTGYNRSTVQRRLDILERRGWVVRTRPDIADARAKKARTVYRLTLPAGCTQHLADGEARGTQHPELGAQGGSTRRTGHPNQTVTNVQSSGRTPERTVADATDATQDETTDLIEQIRAGNPGIRDLGAYVATLAANGDLGQHLTQIRDERRRADTRAALDEARAKPPCIHGEPGGTEPHPTSGEPLCALCRAAA